MTVPFLLQIHDAMTRDFVTDTLLVEPHGAQVTKYFVLLSDAAKSHHITVVRDGKSGAAGGNTY